MCLTASPTYLFWLIVAGAQTGCDLRWPLSHLHIWEAEKYVPAAGPGKPSAQLRLWADVFGKCRGHTQGQEIKNAISKMELL